MGWFMDNVVSNSQVRKYYMLATIFGGIALVLSIKWWAALIILPAQIVYVVWVMWEQDSFAMIETEVMMAKEKKRRRKQE